MEAEPPQSARAEEPAVPRDQGQPQRPPGGATRHPAGEAPIDAQRVLEQIGTEGELAALERRVVELEGDLARAEIGAVEAERGRRGELALMRARLEDALAMVADSMRQQREAHAALEQQMTSMVAEVAPLRREVRELASRTAELAHRLDETERLAGAAGRAIAAAVRRSHTAPGGQGLSAPPAADRDEPPAPTGSGSTSP